ncbi:unnamed protein product [Eruca vesicaria subsp. sativa]|uniref:Uncharacterized protein n=1 Tax=Eruca vesicaria subsp. sativa TaxID=29727 RepID=A0ABC8KBA1_ERUVS|nr:unnamed protein product [Eruca vesicaria subsp. sativa]
MMVQDEAFLVLVAAVVVVVAAAWAVLLGNLEIGFARGQAAMNTTSQAGQSVSGATPQRNPLIHPTSPNFLHHLQENGRVRRDKTSEEPKQDNDHLSLTTQ